MKQERTIRNQELVLDALVKFRFNQLKSCKAAGISYAQFKAWKKSDEEFKQRLSSVRQYYYNAIATEDLLYEIERMTPRKRKRLLNKIKPTENTDFGLPVRNL